MSRFLLTPQAELDLADIWDYIAQDSIQNADRVLDEFEKTMPALTWPRGNSLDDSRSLGYTEIDAGRDIPSAVPEKVP
ncbi:MAG: hypothetical protein AUJ52_13030 [Elusimicrobia bacterium CG1_02_63_36]|nr:MAG: hypothetical protein AUJ52_13030 [Elusimicrobia bacterium CG1_02_63_36]